MSFTAPSGKPGRPLALTAAYQGRGWRPRRARLAEELGRVWAPWRVGSESGRLQAVLLHRPGAELRGIADPNAVQHLGRVSPAGLRREIDGAAALFRRLGVRVHFLPSGAGARPPKPNLVFVRDLFFNTPEGAVVSRMASEVRAGEERSAAAALAALGVPVLRTVSGRGTFEGADALWLDRRTVVCGVGNRTNAEGFRQLREVLAAQGVAAVAAPMPKGVQHLLGLLQIVDAKLALLRHEKAPKALARLLKRRRFRVVPIPESAEVVAGQGMNVVTVSPRRIVMPADCPRLGEIYRSAGLHVAGTADVRQLRLAAGGLACAVGILSRAPRPTPSYKPAPRLAATASRDGR